MTTKEKVLLAVVDYKVHAAWPPEEIAGEMVELVSACGGEVVETVYCRLDHPSAAHLIGEGKVQELAAVCAACGADTVIFSADLKGSQQRNLEEHLKTRTIDRTQLILDIFARHAVSREGKMQVELAQMEYLLPRLVGKGVEMSRLGGGIGTMGPGETKLEVDRRKIGERIDRLKRDLKDVAADRALKRKKRQEHGVPQISLVGYTNAGKSTLLNTLTDAHQLTRDGVFTTLDSLARQMTLPNHQRVVFSDTVGFMHDLPHNLIESFHATLEEVREADLLVHVLDISHPHFRHLYEAVQEVLSQIGAQDKPVITVLNKIDRITDPGHLEDLTRLFKDPVVISGLRGDHLPSLLERIMKELAALVVTVELDLPMTRMDLVNLAYKDGQVLEVVYQEDRIHVRAVLPVQMLGVFQKAALPGKT